MTATLPCRCGAVALEVSGNPIAQFFCHCDDCQAVHGAAYVPESVYPAEADGLPHYESRPARFGGSDETVNW